MPDMIRIANAGGYWGDDLGQFQRQVELGPIDYVTLDFLAEITMSIMQKQRARDPRAGYARDFVAQVERDAAAARPSDVTVDHQRRRREPARLPRRAARDGARSAAVALEVAAVVGDDLIERLGELNAAGVTLDNMDDGARVRRACATACRQRQRLLRRVAGGRGAGERRADRGDRPLHRHRHHAGADDPRVRLGRRTTGTGSRAGIVAGHIVECGAQSTGGNFTDWREREELRRPSATR